MPQDARHLTRLYEDSWLVAIDKPCGLLSVPGKRQLPNAQDMIGHRVTHRLDMDTSGILLAAKTDEVFVAMQRLFARHEGVKKEYVAILEREMGEQSGTISLPLSADFLNRPREVLFDRINRRVDKMMEEGLLEEARGLLPYRDLNALNTVGYRELFDCFDGKCTLEQAVTDIKTHTRRYAKRQITWFKREYQEILL